MAVFSPLLAACDDDSQAADPADLGVASDVAVATDSQATDAAGPDSAGASENPSRAWPCPDPVDT